ncbi:amino acid ABC transporter permease [Nocardioides sp. YIM 152315]|uniref:amino acid ABC transporter permease n=1 Tax=Nocardioides sp. YIM 152315 TaxID=3031760 RepID=UPI0023DB78E7|nr:amino acid ABC transporter permease [Nocardioides sp. YIM 152315]MDF1605840.1 amino acid ABC transporter permease [Nocardioides sp. YIM 152315]
MTITTSQTHDERTLLPQVRLKHWGRWVVAALIIALVLVLVWSAAGGNIDYAAIPGYLVHPVVLEGLVNTIVLALTSMAAAIVVGVVIALMRVSNNPVASVFAVFYVWLFRGLPLLVQILLWYNLALVFPQIVIGVPGTDLSIFESNTNDVMTAFFAAFLGLALSQGGYMAEIVRAGLKSVDSGQIEAAQSIGQTPMQRTFRIVLPQAMPVIIPPTGNNFIDLLKSTSLASVIGFLELVKASNNISSFNLQVMETLIAAAIWYMVLVTVASIGQRFLERAFDKRGRKQGMPARLTTGRSLSSSIFSAPFMRTKR